MYNINSRKIACGARTHGRHMKYKIVTYGCQMNVHESEKLAGLLARAGYECTENSEEADVLVFNTCCIRDTAERRALGNIGVTKALKRRNPSLIVAVCGCMPQQEGAAERIAAHYPYIDIILGTRNISRLPAEIERVLAAPRRPKTKGQAHRRDGYARGLSLRGRGDPHAQDELSERLGQHHLRLQQFLHLLHRPVCARQGDLEERGRRARRGEEGGGRRLWRDHAARTKCQFLRARPRRRREFRAAASEDRPHPRQVPRALHDFAPQRPHPRGRGGYGGVG